MNSQVPTTQVGTTYNITSLCLLPSVPPRSHSSPSSMKTCCPKLCTLSCFSLSLSSQKWSTNHFISYVLSITELLFSLSSPLSQCISLWNPSIWTYVVEINFHFSFISHLMSLWASPIIPFFVVVAGSEPRAPFMLNKCSFTELYPQPFVQLLVSICVTSLKNVSIYLHYFWNISWYFISWWETPLGQEFL